MSKREFAVFLLLLLLFGVVFTRHGAHLLFSLIGAWILFQALVKRNRTVWIVLASVALSVIVFEYVGGKILKRRMAREFQSELTHYPKPDPRRGFNEDGVRTFGGHPRSAFTPASFNFIFLGDSFTQGYMVPKDDSFPFQLGELLEKACPGFRFQIANFGWISASPLLSLERLKQLGARYSPDVVFLCLDMTDFHDDVKYRDRLENPSCFSPFTFLLYRFRLAPQWQAFKKGLRFRASEPAVPEERYFIVNQPLEKSRKYLGEIERNIRALDAYSRDTLGARFVLVLLPRHIQYNADETPRNRLEPGEYTPMGPYVMEPFAWLAGFGREVEFPVFSLLDDFRNSGVFPTCFATDPHWNRQGHAVAARGMMRILRELSSSGQLPLPLAAPR
ncbi:MAG: hypothetical protein JXO51_07925 [Candidatus Aminicenantes bacterium]|nr:hypothetical protein [Candidatus Aminicenantes bacterium]